jgi:predicted RNA-binding protein with RPS1 domain
MTKKDTKEKETVVQVAPQVAGQVVEQGAGIETERLTQALVQELSILDRYRHELKQKLIQGVDYGEPYQNAPKMQLLKPGADKLRYLLQVEITSEETTPVIMNGKIIGFQVKLTMYSKRLKQQNVISRLCLTTEPGKDRMRLDTILAIARKRSYVYGIVELAGLSDMFVDELDESIAEQQQQTQQIAQQQQTKKVIEITTTEQPEQQQQKLSETQLKSYAKTFWSLLMKKAQENGIQLKNEEEKQNLKRLLLQYLFLDTPIESLKDLTQQQWREIWRVLKEEDDENKLKDVFEIYKGSQSGYEFL